MVKMKPQAFTTKNQSLGIAPGGWTSVMGWWSNRKETSTEATACITSLVYACDLLQRG
jgi:hypothetical protein